MPTNNPNHQNNLKPFTTETARAAGKKSAATRKAKRQANQLLNTNNATQLNQHLETLQTTFQREQLPTQATAAAQHLIAKIATGQIEIESKDIAQVITALVNVARLEEGQATSTTMVAHVTSSDARRRLEELKGGSPDTIEMSPVREQRGNSRGGR